MKTRFKPKQLKDQTIVITGASSGIGLATAIMAAEKGANVVLAARSAGELEIIRNEIIGKRGKAISVPTDVSNYKDLLLLKDKALKEFGNIDTWINNAGTSIFGYLFDSDIDEERKLFDTNFWGTRMGSSVAVEAMKKNGGVLINLGSEVSVASQPLMGMYSATKHALKAFTDALRSELKDRNLPIEVCLVRPTAIDTPFAEPPLPSQMYHPNVAARAILKCAENPQRDVYVGGPARLSAIIDTFFPHVKDMMAEQRMKEIKKGTVAQYDNKEEGLQTEITTLGVFKTLKDNLKTSLKDLRKEVRH